MAKVKSLKDLIVLLLYAKGHNGKQYESVLGRTRLMKMVFLFDKEIRSKFNLEKKITDEALPDFEPYDCGPFSEKVYEDLEFLVDLGYVKVRHIGDVDGSEQEQREYAYWQANLGASELTDNPKGVDEFFLSQVGKQFVKDGELGDLLKDQWEVLDKFKARCTGISLIALLRYVYTKYPKMTTKSKIREHIA